MRKERETNKKIIEKLNVYLKKQEQKNGTTDNKHRNSTK